MDDGRSSMLPFRYWLATPCAAPVPTFRKICFFLKELGFPSVTSHVGTPCAKFRSASRLNFPGNMKPQASNIVSSSMLVIPHSCARLLGSLASNRSPYHQQDRFAAVLSTSRKNVVTLLRKDSRGTSILFNRTNKST